MWTSTNFKTYPKEFDFSSLEEGKSTLTTLQIDGIELMNMIEKLSEQDAPDLTFQFIICAHCGICQCKPEGWLALRQAGDLILLIPAFERIKNEPVGGEYAPPLLLEQKGALYFSPSDFEKFQSLVPAFANLDKIIPLNNFEAVSLYKWDTPYKIFGEPPDFGDLHRDQVVAVSELDLDTLEQIIEDQLLQLATAKEFSLRKIGPQDQIISLFLDDPEATEWRAICRTDDDYKLLLGGELLFTYENE